MLAEYYFFTGMTLVPDLVPVGSALVPGSACSRIAVNSSIWALVPGLVPVGSGSGVLCFPVQASLAKASAWRNVVNYRLLLLSCEHLWLHQMLQIPTFCMFSEHHGLPKCCKYALHRGLVGGLVPLVFAMGMVCFPAQALFSRTLAPPNAVNNNIRGPGSWLGSAWFRGRPAAYTKGPGPSECCEYARIGAWFLGWFRLVPGPACCMSQGPRIGAWFQGWLRWVPLGSSWFRGRPAAYAKGPGPSECCEYARIGAWFLGWFRLVPLGSGAGLLRIPRALVPANAVNTCV